MEKGSLISQGRTAEIYEWGSSEIIKLYKKEMPYEAVVNEFNISSMLNGKGLNTPYALQMLKVGDRHGIVFERIYGRTMISALTSKPWAIVKLAKNLAELHYSLHKCSISGIIDVKDRLRRDIERADLLERDKKEEIIQYLNSLENGNVLCHGDFHPDNVLVNKDRTVVIDWMTGCSGNPVYDVARTHILISIGTVPPGTSAIKKILIEKVRSKFHDEYLKHYLAISGVSVEEVERWLLPVAAARLCEWLPDFEKEQLLRIVNDKLLGLKK